MTPQQPRTKPSGGVALAPLLPRLQADLVDRLLLGFGARAECGEVFRLHGVDGDITAGLFQDHPHITVFPGDGIDVMPVVMGPPED